MMTFFRDYKLIFDSSEYQHETPKRVYETLRQWLEDSFPKNYSKFIRGISEQFQEEYKGRFKGFELIGDGVGRSGDSFYIHDLAIVDLILSPVLQDYIKQANGWKWIKENILDPNVSVKNPIFAKRAVVPILIEQLQKDKLKVEAKGYLAGLIKQRKGIPSASEITFDKLRSQVDKIDHKVLLELVKEDTNHRANLPTSVFVVILMFQLMGDGNKGAKRMFFGSKFLRNPKYFEYDLNNYNTLTHFHLIANDPDLQWEILKKFLKQKNWAEKMEKDAFARGDVQQALRSFIMAGIKHLEKKDISSFLQGLLQEVFEDGS